MENNEMMKQWIFELFIRLISQQEVNNSKLTQRVGEEMQKMKDELGFDLDLNISEIHLIACIGDHEPINVTTVSEKINLTKGSITRISTKLLRMELICRVQLNENKKEVYFRLTPKGRKVYEIHARLHHEVEQRFKRFLNKYTPEQLAFSKMLLKDLLDWEY
ncbi:MarR family transcriptional regulator [Bacillus sp. TL12]|uniref:MarR family transcriptional regulator n=1 Tax=Bacillus sp. TL12 TaxID=2894756 RepID=UPI001F52B421|nr:MarR family transcriptional regulator [Bacillus sp. TL12]MCI0768267.1 MarR family transcriptional regulator [Bacillus sp. TL12]